MSDVWACRESGEISTIAESCYTLIHAGFDAPYLTAIRDGAEAELHDRLRLYIAARHAVERVPRESLERTGMVASAPFASSARTS